MRDVFGLPDPMSVMSPVHIPRGFTKAYIDGDVVEDLGARIRAAHMRRSRATATSLLIEGTGHAGVGAVVGLSNATVAAMLGAPAIIVSEGGVGRPIDEIVLNASLFAAHGVHVAGAIVNKVRLDAQPDIADILERGLAPHGIPLLGVAAVPADPVEPDARHDPGGRARRDDLARARPRPRHRRRRDRRDGARAHAGARRARDAGHRAGRSRGRDPRARAVGRRRREGRHGVGLVLTGGYRPRPLIVDAIRAADLFATLVAEDTYAVASEVHDLLVKTHSSDDEKIALIKALVAEHLDVDRILDVAAPAGR